MREAVQQFRQNLIRRDQPHLAKQCEGANCSGAVLVEGVKGRAPIKRVRKNLLHFRFGAPWR